MAYYQGDYYAGDYYRGDPFWGGLFRAVKGTLGFLTGIGGRGGSKIVAPSASAAGAGMAAITGAARSVGMRAGSMIAKHPVLSAAGAAGTIGILGGHKLGSLGMVPAGRHGLHLNRRGQMVRNRHMRVTNPKALRRAIRRTSGFAKLAMRVIHLTHPQKKVKFGGFKKRRKR